MVRGVLAGVTPISSPLKTHTTFQAVVCWQGSPFTCSVLIDSGAEGNFMDERWAIEHGIPLCELTDPPTAFALDDRVLSNILRATEAVSFTI